jgi:hypothetical protein
MFDIKHIPVADRVRFYDTHTTELFLAVALDMQLCTES